MMEGKSLAVIILNWNGRKLLEEFLPQVLTVTSGPEVDVIVADNGSEDDSVEWLAENYPEVQVIRFDKNYGFAEGYNRALAMTRYPYTVLLNSDVAPDEGWWQPMLDFMKSHTEAGAVQPKIHSYCNPDKFEYAGAAGGLLDRLGYPYCRGRVFDNIETDSGQYDDKIEEIAWASGAAIMVDTELYLRLGGLDERFFAHMEEIDLCCRIYGAGRKVYVIPSASVRHLGGASLPYGNPHKTYLNFRNNLLLLHKNLPAKRGRKILFIRRLADTLAFGLFLAKGQFKDAKMVLKAHNDFKKLRKEYTDLPATDVLRNLPGAERWIVADHFLKRK